MLLLYDGVVTTVLVGREQVIILNVGLTFEVKSTITKCRIKCFPLNVNKYHFSIFRSEFSLNETNNHLIIDKPTFIDCNLKAQFARVLGGVLVKVLAQGSKGPEFQPDQ